MIRFSGLFVAAMFLSPWAHPAPAAEAEWPQFLGPNRNGISAETGLIDAFPASGPKVVWRTPAGVGMSGVAVSRGSVVTAWHADGKQCVVALDAATGKERWRTPIAPEYSNSMGNGTRATPAIAGDRVFLLSGEAILVALNFADGKLLWSTNLVDQAGAQPAEYGVASSPLVVGERVIVVGGGPQATVVAVNAADGKIAWKTGDDPAGYSSPTLLDLGGRKQIVAFSGSSVLGLEPDMGALLWRHPYQTDFNCNTATPVAAGGGVYVSSGENHGGALLALTPAGDRFNVKEVWASQGVRSTLRTEWQTAIVLDGHLYGFDNVGGAGPVTHLTCINAATGERVWQQQRFGKGNMIAADGKLWCSMMNGELIVVRATPKAYEELARADVGIRTRQAPALVGGLLYLRDDENVLCVDVRR
jgi:outer membrane protein assembly factor BamB